MAKNKFTQNHLKLFLKSPPHLLSKAVTSFIIFNYEKADPSSSFISRHPSNSPITMWQEKYSKEDKILCLLVTWWHCSLLKAHGRLHVAERK